MKAVYLLICLALPSHIAGNIFRKNKAIYWPAVTDYLQPNQQEQSLEDRLNQQQNQELQQQRLQQPRYEYMSYQNPEYRILKSRDSKSQESEELFRDIGRIPERRRLRKQENNGKTVFVTIVKNIEPSEKRFKNIELNKFGRDYPVIQKSSESKEIKPEDIYSKEREELVYDENDGINYEDQSKGQSKETGPKILIEVGHDNSKENKQESQEKYNPNQDNSKENKQESQEKQNPKSLFNKDSMESREQTQNNNNNNNNKNNNVNVHNTGLRRFLPNNWPLFNALTNLAYPTYDSGVSWADLELAQEPSAVAEYYKEVLSVAEKAYKNIEPQNEEDKKRFHVDFETAKHLNNEDVHLNATQLSRKYNYDVEEHSVQTKDGYTLSILRIRSKTLPTNQGDRPVTFLMHGLLGSADDWLVMGPNKSLAYYLADAGFDVWLGNVRGNKYSLRHVTKRPDQEQFWHYTNDEIASYDLPAMIDYVLQTTHKAKLFYIGHAQGTTTFFALMASYPEYNAKITAMYALSPMAYMAYAHSPMLRLAAPHGAFYDHLHNLIGHKEFKPEGNTLKLLGGELCETKLSCDVICSNVNFVLSGVNEARLNASDMPVFLSHMPGGASTRVIKHYGQSVSSQEFNKYNYGSTNNLHLYGRSSPPTYDLKLVTAPVSLYYSDDDWLAHPKDVERLQAELSNVKETYKVPQPWSHMDYVLSTFAPELVYQKLYESLKTYSS